MKRFLAVMASLALPALSWSGDCYYGGRRFAYPSTVYHSYPPVVHSQIVYKAPVFVEAIPVKVVVPTYGISYGQDYQSLALQERIIRMEVQLAQISQGAFRAQMQPQQGYIQPGYAQPRQQVQTQQPLQNGGPSGTPLPNGQQSLPPHPDSVYNKSGQAAANASKCVACHGQVPKGNSLVMFDASGAFIKVDPDKKLESVRRILSGDMPRKIENPKEADPLGDQEMGQYLEVFTRPGVGAQPNGVSVPSGAIQP